MDTDGYSRYSLDVSTPHLGPAKQKTYTSVSLLLVISKPESTCETYDIYLYIHVYGCVLQVGYQIMQMKSFGIETHGFGDLPF